MVNRNVENSDEGRIVVWLVKDDSRNTYFCFTRTAYDDGWTRNPAAARFFETRENACKQLGRFGHRCMIEPRKVLSRSLAMQRAREWLVPWARKDGEIFERLNEVVAEFKAGRFGRAEVTDESVLTKCMQYGLDAFREEGALFSAPSGGTVDIHDAWNRIVWCGLSRVEDELAVNVIQAIRRFGRGYRHLRGDDSGGTNYPRLEHSNLPTVIERRIAGECAAGLNRLMVMTMESDGSTIALSIIRNWVISRALVVLDDQRGPTYFDKILRTRPTIESIAEMLIPVGIESVSKTLQLESKERAAAGG